jgi:hypothetical protein
MRYKMTNLLVAAAFGVSNPAFAQTDLTAQINALPLSEMCSKTGAMGQKFGATDLTPSTMLSRGAANLPLELRFAPFDKYGLSTTKYSNKMYEAVFNSIIDQELTEDSLKAIAARFVASGWTPVKTEDQTFDIELNLNPENEPDGYGIRVTLQPLEGGVMLTCQNVALLEEHYAEATGGYPANLPRPAPPISRQETAAIAVPVSCDDPASSKQAIDAFKNGEWMASHTVTAEEDYQERLAAWKSSKLVASGKVERTALAERQLQLLASNGAIDALNKNVDDFSKLLPEIEKLEKLEKSGDTVALCRGIERLKSQLTGFATNASANNKDPWAATHKFLDAEAMRLGVTFPQ